jgi:hypothetical protein
MPPFGDSFEVEAELFGGKAGLGAARSDDARPFGHNTKDLAVLITLKGYR